MKLNEMRKALAPLVLGVLAIGTEWIASGEWNVAEFRTALAALVTAVVVWFVRNEPPTPDLTPPPVGRTYTRKVPPTDI